MSTILVKFKHVDSVSVLRGLVVTAMVSQSKGREFESRCGQEEIFIL